MQTYLTRTFSRFARHQKISNSTLCDVADRMKRGLIDANLGGGVIKQRIPRINAGRSGGYRSIILYQIHNCAFFVYGFAKSQRANIDRNELREFQELAKLMFAYSDQQIKDATEQGRIIEVKCYEKIQK